MELQPRKSRRHGLDTIRGLALVNMILYHLSWDQVYMFGADWDWYRSDGAYVWQQGICWTFILLSGYCFHLGRHRLHRGLMAFGGGLLVSAVTWVAMPESRIFFGVLSLLGTSALLLIPLEKPLRKIPTRLGAAVSFTLFMLFGEVNRGWLGFEGALVAKLPDWLYQNYLTAALGFPQPGFYSSDYFPLLPWFFLFLTGFYLYPLRQEDPNQLRLPVLTWMGRHSLLIYLLHQPVLYALGRTGKVCHDTGELSLGIEGIHGI